MPRVRRSTTSRAAEEEVPVCNSRIFNSKAASDRYAKLVSRHIVEDRGIDLDVTTIDFVRRIIDAHGWSKFVHPVTYKNVPANLIREFYANFSTVKKDDCVFVRKRLVPFSPRSINTFLATPNRQECFYRSALANSLVPIEQIIDVTCLEGTEWEPKQDMTKIKVARNQLKPEVKTIFHFVIHSLLPQHKQSEVYYKHLLLLYCIMRNEKIDVGQIIFGLIWDIRRSNAKVGLPFPSLIFSLCQSAKVTGYSDQPQSKCQKPISIANVFQYFTQSGVAPPYCPTSGSSVPPPQRRPVRPPPRAIAGPRRARPHSEWRSKRNEDKATRQVKKKTRLSIAKTLKKVVKYCKYLGRQVVALRKENRELRQHLQPGISIPLIDDEVEGELVSEETDIESDIQASGPSHSDIDRLMDDTAIDLQAQFYNEMDGNASSSEEENGDEDDNDEEDNDDEEEESGSE